MPDTLRQLEEIVAADPSLAPMAALQVEALRASADSRWSEFVVVPEEEGRLPDAPLIHDCAISLNPDLPATLLARMLEATGGERTQPLKDALDRRRIDPLVLLQAAVNQDDAEFQGLADRSDTDAPLLVTFGQLMTRPLLAAFRARMAKPGNWLHWNRGYCPVCGGWPTLAEIRGTFRERWLRCGRCGEEWTFPHGACAYCGNDDHRTLGYLAPEDRRESQRADTCDRCHGYLKSFATMLPMEAGEVGLQDLTSLELDMGAMSRGYGRPGDPAYPLRVVLKPLET